MQNSPHSAWKKAAQQRLTNATRQHIVDRSRVAFCLRHSAFCLLHPAFCILLAACAAPWIETGPPPTPTPLLAPYNAAVATAEAATDAQARARAYYERGNVQLDQGDAQAAVNDYTRAL